MIRIALLAGCFASTAMAQHAFDNELVVTFRGAGALRIHTESSRPNSRYAGGGVVAVDKGDVSHRRVLDRRGEVVFAYDLRLDAPARRLVFTDPVTGEQLFDLLERVEAPLPAKQPSPEEEISLEAMRITVNGKLISESRNSWIISDSIPIKAPAPFRVVSVPREGQTPVAVGRVEGRTLTFTADADQVKIDSRSNIFKTRESGPVWIYRD
jgi:hypothetical protein